MKYYNNLQEIEEISSDFFQISLNITPEYSENLIQHHKNFIKEILVSWDVSIEDVRIAIRDNVKSYEEHRLYYVAKKIEWEVKEKKISKYLVAVDSIKKDLADIIRISDDPEIISQKIRFSTKNYIQACQSIKTY